MMGQLTSPYLREKYERLMEILRELGSVVVAFSGGVDSTFLARAAKDALGDRALLVTADSESYPSAELEEARRLADLLGMRHRVVKTFELENSDYASNPPNRCYFCKDELFTKLEPIAREEGLAHVIYGANLDDLGDHRPGMKAAREKQVKAPLIDAGLSKAEIRELSRRLGLPTWNKPSFACLSSRFPYGYGITKENLMKIDNAETLLRDLGFRSFRVRQHDDKTARIEVGIDEIKRLMEDEVRQKIVAGLKDLGFTYVTVDLQGYRTGSMNEVLTIEVKKQYTK